MERKTATEARQGESSPGHMVRHALIGGIILAVIAVIAAYIWIF